MTLRELKYHLSSPRANPPAERFLDEFVSHCKDNDELGHLPDSVLEDDMPQIVEALADFAQRRIDGEVT